MTANQPQGPNAADVALLAAQDGVARQGDDAGAPPSRLPTTVASNPLHRMGGRWFLLTVFTLITFQSLLVAFALQGNWWLALAPAAICGYKAWRIRQEIQVAVDQFERYIQPLLPPINDARSSGSRRGRPSRSRQASVDSATASS